MKLIQRNEVSLNSLECGTPFGLFGLNSLKINRKCFVKISKKTAYNTPYIIRNIDYKIGLCLKYKSLFPSRKKACFVGVNGFEPMTLCL